jgi:hypothetical protein
MLKIGIVGTRKPKITFEKFSQIIDDYKPIHIVSGGAKGIDTFAENYAKLNNIPFTIFPPEYNKYGRIATFVRNQQIVDASDMIIAFTSKESKGTIDTIRRTKRSNKSLKVHLI